MKKIAALLLLSVFAFQAQANTDSVWEKKRIEQGRRLVRIAGCNDCHTPQYSQMGGQLPEKDWLVGSEVGFSGPWGTSYASNLRLTASSYQEKAFVSYLRQKKYLPPMPGFIFKYMTDEELGSVHAFIKHLGAAGKMAPANLSPSNKPKGPYIKFVPQVDN